MLTGRRAWAAAAAPVLLLLAWSLAPGTGPWAAHALEGAVVQYRHRNSSMDTRAASVIGGGYTLIRLADGIYPAVRR